MYGLMSMYGLMRLRIARHIYMCRGGKKASGFGRELGTHGFSSYQNIKQITTYVSKDKWDWYPSKL